jgi:uncharacterized Zn finger protein
MSDDFAICPVCGAINEGFKEITKPFNDVDDGELKCNSCGAIVQYKKLLWKHVEYCNGKVIE